MTLQERHIQQGATLAPDLIPLHFGDQAAEYAAALEGVILLDRSHEARLSLQGASALDLVNRISTNKVIDLPLNTGKPTIFINANARVIDRAIVFQREGDVLLLGEPGRGPALHQYIQRNIFFGDDVTAQSLLDTHRQFDLHGPQAQALITAIDPALSALPVLQLAHSEIAGHPVQIAHQKPVIGSRWSILVQNEHASEVWSALTDGSLSPAATPAGSIIYNTLRVRAGLPNVNRELSADYIPLEIALWDEVSFNKGCYTGQEIIARMESRGRLAKTLVSLKLEHFVAAPAEVYSVETGRSAGTLTSSVTAPTGEIFAIAMLKTAHAEIGEALTVGEERIPASVSALPGAQPPQNG